MRVQLVRMKIGRCLSGRASEKLRDILSLSRNAVCYARLCTLAPQHRHPEYATVGRMSNG
jgi:hypothetical protein